MAASSMATGASFTAAMVMVTLAVAGWSPPAPVLPRSWMVRRKVSLADGVSLLLRYTTVPPSCPSSSRLTSSTVP